LLFWYSVFAIWKRVFGLLVQLFFEICVQLHAVIHHFAGRRITHSLTSPLNVPLTMPFTDPRDITEQPQKTQKAQNEDTPHFALFVPFCGQYLIALFPSDSRPFSTRRCRLLVRRCLRLRSGSFGMPNWHSCVRSVRNSRQLSFCLLATRKIFLSETQAVR